jgi:hypothetical protein
LAGWLEENPSHEHHEDAKGWWSAKQKELAESDAWDASF